MKGSTFDRYTKHIERVDRFKALKDLDFMWMTNVENELIQFSEEDKNIIKETLKDDLTMLREVNIMDYSLLLLIIHYPEEYDSEYNNILNIMKEERYSKRVFKSKNGKYLYCIGIIDYLQKFNMSKFLENKYKRIFISGEKSKGVSAVDPIMYADRMKLFVANHILI